MNVWEFIDLHPVLTVVLVLLFMSCLPMSTTRWYRKSSDGKWHEVKGPIDTDGDS